MILTRGIGKVYLVLSLVHLILVSAIAQPSKHVIDTSVYEKWPYIEPGTAGLTNDGKFARYTIKNRPVGSQTTVFQSTKGSWKKEVSGIFRTMFSNDSYKAIYQTKDTLNILNLGTEKLETINGVSFYELSKEGNWLLYQTNDSEKSLIVRNLKSGLVRQYRFVVTALFSADGKQLILQSEPRNDTNNYLVKWINLEDGSNITIFTGGESGSFIWNKKGNELAFLAPRTDKTTAIWVYKLGENKAHLVTDAQTRGLNERFNIISLTNFNDAGSHIFFKIKRSEIFYAGPINYVDVNIWSYTDEKVQSKQLKELDANDFLSQLMSSTGQYEAVLDVAVRKIIRLEEEGDKLIEIRANNALIYHKTGDAIGEEWNKASITCYYLVSFKDGKRTAVLNEFGGGVRIAPYFSPCGRYLVYFDPLKRNYFSYNVETSANNNLTESICTNWLAIQGRVEDSMSVRAVAGWLEDDQAVLVYDRYDLWQLDLSGRKKPKNITAGIGTKDSILFSLPQDYYKPNVFPSRTKLLLSAFNLGTKDNGFYSVVLDQVKPEGLTMGSYLYEIGNNAYGIGTGSSIIKARDSNVYLVSRSRSSESLNYFLTKDLKSFTNLSNLYPERAFTWLTSELHTWRSLDGRKLQGLLFKPENFDPSKKYPVIFFYYERLSDGLHEFKKPQALEGGCSINIPTYVSQGYLIFCPDIYYTIGDPMQGSHDAVVSAVQYLSRFPFVDSKKIGAQGCSFGGIQTAYLVTQTSLFAAVASASATYNWVTTSGSLSIRDGTTLLDNFEKGQLRMGGTLWDIPQQYIKNSPVFHASRVKTPILMMHTTQDAACPWPDALEFFIALRRLGKKGWLLQYNGDHAVSGIDANDFSIRMQQFFDHYLKDKPAPKWMTRGVPAKLKGMDNGLDYDQEITTPGDGLLFKPEPIFNSPAYTDKY